MKTNLKNLLDTSITTAASVAAIGVSVAITLIAACWCKDCIEKLFEKKKKSNVEVIIMNKDADIKSKKH